MAQFKTIGKVVSIGDTQVFNDKFQKRSIIIDENYKSKYPSLLEVEYANDKSKYVGEEGITEGDIVEASGTVKTIIYKRKDGSGESSFTSARGETLSYYGKPNTPNTNEDTRKDITNADLPF